MEYIIVRQYCRNYIILSMSNIIKSIPYEQLLSTGRKGFQTFGLSKGCVDDHCRRLRHLASFMEEEQILEYTSEVGEKFIEHFKTDTIVSGGWKERIKGTIRYLHIFMNGEEFHRRERIKEYFCPDTELGRLAEEFIVSLAPKRLSFSSIMNYRYNLYLFTEAMRLDNVELSNLDRPAIMRFISARHKSRRVCAMVVKFFMAYLYERKLTSKDLSTCLKGINDEKHKPVISYYTPEEVHKIENAIDRTTATGKRDYAMVLLASRLGLRSSDIVELEFSNLDWDNSQIHLVQYKTKRSITLPLLSDVGNAIIDYIRNGRPKTDLKNIFVSSIQPYSKLRSIGSMVRRYITISDVFVSQRHKGAHCLRHSLATTLMNNGTQMPVISEVLGHTSTENTMFYLGVNVSALIECSMDVPPVSDRFYHQKGGAFYE